MNKKLIGIGAAAVAVVAVVVIACIFLFGGSSDDGYRVIKVYQVDGSATLNRPGVGDMEAYENMTMQDKDKLMVMDKSFVRLKMDNDKYALAEANTVLSIDATGTEKDSKTNINLQEGAITIEIQNKLGSESSYQVTTPNSVMAVRGTVFRISVTQDENGKPMAKLDVFEGTVTVQRKNVNEKGEEVIEEEIYSADKGSQIIVYFSDNQEENIIYENEEPDYSDLPLDTLYYLQEIVDSRDLVFTEEEIVEMIQSRLEEEPSVEEESGEEEEESVPESEEESSEAVIESSEESIEVAAQPSSSEESSTVPSSSEESVVPSSSEESSTVPSSSEEPSSEEPSEEQPSSYTVTFVYNGQTFATQTVTAGSSVSKPKLQPSSSGNWEFDFTTIISEDTVIQWK